MKIACQSCQAKYTIADEKVVGKVVKIRCKKCGATIVVNGQDTGAGSAGQGNDEMTEVRSSSAELGGHGGGEADGWTVNVADDDQRTLTTHQVVAEFSRGTISDETYCWRDGMGDWLPLREIEELAAACGLSEAAAFAQQAPVAAAPMKRASVRPAAGGGGLAGIFGSSPPGAMGNAPGSQPAPAQLAPAARRAGGRAGGADLFGAAAEAGGENDVMTSAPQSGSPHHVGADDGKMTGQRNENSVLFSLNALTANEPKKNGGAGGGGLLGAAQGDGSGLIDIRALSSSMASSGPKKTNHADDIMNLGGGGAFSAALAAPVLTAPPLDSGDPNAPSSGAQNKKIFMMFGGLALLLVFGMVVMFFMLQPKAPAPVAGTTPEGSATAASPGAPASPGTAAPGAPAASTAAAAPPADTTAAGTAPAAVADNSPKAAAPSVGVKHPSSGGGYTAPPPVEHSAPVAVAPPPPPANNSLDSLMAGAVGGNKAPSNPAPAAAASEPFDRGAASASLGGIADSVASCKKPGGPTGDGHVSITFAPSGHVLSAVVDQPPYAGTAVGGCVAGKFRSAHVPPFAGGNMPVGKRFSIN